MQTDDQEVGRCLKDSSSTAEQQVFPTAWISLTDLK